MLTVELGRQKFPDGTATLTAYESGALDDKEMTKLQSIL
jgi:hypothetical protein